MPGLVPGIHVLFHVREVKDVDGRDKPGHDVLTMCACRRKLTARYFHSILVIS